uniref:Uncharacterized protein LOC101500259 n=1 Tax=Cicer arietinum TaxID=3827 RepID=A0A1S2XAY7_CICAR|nr:uncharacterized protein LOC101500259 [Cicer arietinum]
MGRENHDTTIVHSSIQLLQERFRQLERVKEMREKRELKKMLNEPKQQQLINSNNIITTTPTYESTRLFFSSNNDELINNPSRSSSSPPHVSLSLWPTSSQVKHDDLCTTNYNTHTHAQTLQASWKNGCYDSDSASDSSGLDTSLHL